VGKFPRNQSTHQNDGVGIIKSQKAIANTQSLCEKPEREKSYTHRERERRISL